MALETVLIPISEAWSLASNAVGAFSARVYDGSPAFFHVGSAAPEAGSRIGVLADAVSLQNPDAKVYVRSANGARFLTATRPADAGNPAIPTLGAVTLGAAAYTVNAAPGTEIGAIVGLGAGDVIEGIVPNDGRVVLNAAGTKLIVGLSASSVGTFKIRLRVRNPSVFAPKDTEFTITVTPASSLARWKAARAAVASGQRNARLLCLGDSTTFGYGAAGATFGNNLRASAWPTRVANGIPNGSWQSWFGNGDAGAANYYTGAGGADTRINAGSWGRGGGSKVGVGQYPYVATAAGAAFTFTPTTQVDTFEVYYLTDPANGVGVFSFDVLVDGVSVGQINGNQAEGFRKATFAVPLGAHTISCNWISGNCYLSGMVAFNSVAKEVSVINAGSAGAKIGDVSTPSSAARSYSPLNSLAVISPDLINVCFTINDGNLSTAIPTYRTGLQAVIDRGRAINADMIFMSGVPSNPAAKVPQAQQQAYADAFREVAALNSIAVIDMFAEFVDFASANGRGLMIDDVHENAKGYGVVVDKTLPVLLAA